MSVDFSKVAGEAVLTRLGNTLWDALRQCGLLSAQQLVEAQRLVESAQAETPNDVLGKLVSKNLITPFQAERLLEGKTRGFIFDQFKIIDLIGLGGMGWVYQALDTTNNQIVALKVLREDLQNDQGMLPRFQQEAKVGLRLHHPHILQTLSLGSAGGLPYVTMEYVPGPNLLELLVACRRLPWEQACEFARQTALGLSYVHALGIIHRDIKPQNLLVDATGRVRILDFGLSMLQDGEAGDEFSLAMIFGHESVGTVEFAAPEQISDSLRADAKSDIYSLGCTLFASLTGTNPWSKAQAKTKSTELLRSVREVVPTIPQGVAEIVARMVDNDPTKRFASAAVVAEALAVWSKPGPVSFDFAAILRERKLDAERRLAKISPSRVGSGNLARSTARLDVTNASAKTIDLAKVRAIRGMVNTEFTKPTWPATIRGPIVPKSHIPAADDAQVPVLSLIDGTGRIPLRQARILIGRSDECDLQLVDAAVSGKHCELQCDAGQNWWLVDLNSRNGTIVNGRPIKKQRLYAGDELQIGNLHRFQIDGLAQRKKHAPSNWLVYAFGALILLMGLIWLIMQFLR